MTLVRRVTLALAGALVLNWGAASVHAQGYPNKSITLIVPAAAGGPTDTVARLLAESMSRTLGQTVVVENVGGAGGTVGMGRLKGMAPDGYTIGVWHISHATAPALYDNLKYDVVADFDHIGRITDVPMTIVAKKDMPANTIAELFDWIRKEKDKVTYGHAGIGSGAHLCALMLMKELGVQMTAVSYRGTGPAMTDLVGGKLDVMCDQTTNTTNQIKGGAIKGYAVTTKTKVSSLPDLPTLDTTAVKGFDLSIWHAMWAPKGLPKEATDKLVNALTIALADQTVKERLASLGTDPVPVAQINPEALRSHLAAEVARLGVVIKAAGVKGAN
ncbi:MAG: hypothetical protein RL291_2098 [Pseudomonadota bacterium]|jgi:tripartite-type tricarboxylate transporter receptor subunit TctC